MAEVLTSPGLLSEFLDLGSWRAAARLPPAMLFANGRTHEAQGGCWSGTVAVAGVHMAAQKKFSEFCGNLREVPERALL
jgi:hypothetical protein